MGGRETLRDSPTPSPAPSLESLRPGARERDPGGEGSRLQPAATRSALLHAFAFCAFTWPAAAETSAHGLYVLHCSGCHGRDGAGSKAGRVPPFAGVVGHFAGETQGRRYLVLVPGVANSGLSHADTARVLNYVVREWGEGAAPRAYTGEEVGAIRTTRVDDIVALRRSILSDLARRGVRVAY